jgi:hypothetical protein
VLRDAVYSLLVRMTHTAKTLFPLLFAVLLFSGCGRGYRIYELDRTSFDTKTLQMIQSDTGVALPAGARGLNFYYKPPIDPAYIAKIEIPLKSKEDVIRTLSAIENDENTHIMESLGAKVRWWIPKGAKALVDRQTFVRGNYLHVMLTEEDASVILYIEWWVI